METTLKKVILELETRLTKGGLNKAEAADWAAKLQVFTRQRPSRTARAWSPDGLGQIPIQLPPHLQAMELQRLPFSARARYALADTDISTVAQLCQLRADYIGTRRNLGIRTVREIVSLLRDLETIAPEITSRFEMPSWDLIKDMDIALNSLSLKVQMALQTRVGLTFHQATVEQRRATITFLKERRVLLVFWKASLHAAIWKQRLSKIQKIDISKLRGRLPYQPKNPTAVYDFLLQETFPLACIRWR